MDTHSGDERRRPRAWAIVVVVLAVLALAPPAQAAQRRQLSAQPELLQLAASAPHEHLRVIVQLDERGADALGRIPQLGGSIIRDLSLITAVVAVLPAAAIQQLAAEPGVRWVSLDAQMQETNCYQCIATANLMSSYIKTIGADRVWNDYGAIQGQGVTVAIVDTGIGQEPDLRADKSETGGSRVLANVSFGTPNGTNDFFGHGTHIAGIIGGNGVASGGRYIGVAPRVNLVNVKVGNRHGVGYASDLVAGLQWIYQNRHTYNIRVVNLSLLSTVAESYHTSPINAAVEILWFNSIVVVAAAGNGGEGGVRYPPANDPFVITVGAIDDRGTGDWGDDVLAPYSAYGLTESGVSKPDLVAPGSNVVSLKCGDNCTLMAQHPGHSVPVEGGKPYFRMSGTSMAAAVTSGSVALLLAGETRLSPDQVKARLMQSARPLIGAGAGAGVLDIYNALHTTGLACANTGITASQLLWTGGQPAGWASTSWDSTSWNTVSWEAGSWNSATWGQVGWDTIFWGE